MTKAICIRVWLFIMVQLLCTIMYHQCTTKCFLLYSLFYFLDHRKIWNKKLSKQDLCCIEIHRLARSSIQFPMITYLHQVLEKRGFCIVRANMSEVSTRVERRQQLSSVLSTVLNQEAPFFQAKSAKSAPTIFFKKRHNFGQRRHIFKFCLLSIM